MQGTIKEFDEESRTGVILLDDGSEVPLPAPAFSASGLRKLVLGQRVKFETTDGTITRVHIPTMYDR